MFTGRTVRACSAARMVKATNGLVAYQSYSIFTFPFFSEILSEKHNLNTKSPSCNMRNAYSCLIKCSSSLLCSAEVFWQLRHKTKQGKTMKRPDFKIKRALINLSRTVVSFAEIFTRKNLRDSLKQNWLYYCLFAIGSLPMKVKIVLIMCLIDVISLVATGKTISGLSVNFWLSWSVEA